MLTPGPSLDPQRLSADDGKDATLDQIWPTLKKMTDQEWAQHRADEIVDKLRKEKASKIARDFLEKKEIA